MTKRWVAIFRALANVNRVKTVLMLSKVPSLTVTQIAWQLGISLKSTSKHLLMLQELEVLESVGKQGHVYYSLNGSMPKDIKKAISLLP